MYRGPAVLLFLAFVLNGCGATRNEAMAYHQSAGERVQLGMSVSSFKTLMAPADIHDGEGNKAPTRFTEVGDMYVIYYMRSSHVGDGTLTDDEVTPYTFKNDSLVAVGWQALGGPKFTSQDLATRRAAANKTSVNTNVNVNANKNSGGILPCDSPGMSCADPRVSASF
jgi:hypothetical protein